MTSSIELPPLTMGAFKLFFSSQFCATPRMPPADLSLAGQTAIITGANMGIGFACAGMLLDQGLSRLIMAVRSEKKGEAAAAALRAKHPSATVEVWILDMSSYASVRAFADRCSALPRVDVAILNAGLVKETFDLTVDGHEETVQVNYLSTALLAILLLPTLKAKGPEGRPGRLTIVSSGTVFWAALKEKERENLLAAFDDDKMFDNADRYQTTKLLGHFFILKLVEYVKSDDVVVNLVDPGLIKGSGLHTDLSAPFRVVFGLMKTATGRTLKQGASTYIDAAVLRGAETHGSYLMNWDIYPFPAIIYTPEGKKITERLWNETMKELGFAGALSILKSMQTGSK